MTSRPGAIAASLTPEFRLAVATCLWPPGPVRSHAVAAALAPGTPLDWKRFVEIVRRQRVDGLAFHALSGPSTPIPASARQALEAAAGRLTGKSLRLAGETVRLVRALEAAGIRSACIKGAPLSLCAFGDVGLRHSRDIDLLVPPDLARAADAVLSAAGYRLVMPIGPHNDAQKRAWMRSRKHFEYQHPTSGVQMELHWRLFENSRLYSTSVDPGRWSEIPVAGPITVPTLNPRDQLLYLCVHGANHMWSRLKWIADVAALLAQAPEGTVEHLLEDARNSGSTRAVAQALLLSRELFGIPTPAVHIPSDRRTVALVSAAVAAMTSGGGAVEVEHLPFATSRIALARFGLKRDGGFWFEEARNALVDERDRHHTGLPHALRFLLPLVRIPLWVARRATGSGRSNR